MVAEEVLSLVQFMLKTRPNKIRAMNSPFVQETFELHQADRWIRQDKAEIIDGILVFKDEFSGAIRKQFKKWEMEKRQDIAFEAMVDLERSGGTRVDGSFATWHNKNMAMQMKRHFALVKVKK